MKKRIGIFTGDELVDLKSKMAHGVMRYRDDVVVIIDKKYQGKKVKELLTYINKDIPIVGSVEEALSFGIDELLLGAAPPGGQLTKPFYEAIFIALDNNIKVINGSHIELKKSEHFQDFSHLIVDLRYSVKGEKVASGKCSTVDANIILTVGTDCACGKMTTALEIYKEAMESGLNCDFIPTGQTGMYIMDKGFSIDAIVSDFIAGTTEDFVYESAKKHDFVFVEGQGSLTHPAYSGVTLGLMHGSAPNIIVLCHDLRRDSVAYFNKELYPLEEHIELVEKLANYQRESHVLGISLFADDLSDEEMEQIKYDFELKYRVPVFFPTQQGCRDFVELLKEYK